MSYSLKQSNWSSHFAVDSDGGVLSVASPVDYEAVTGGEITLTVTASDKGQPPLSGYVNVTVTLQVSVFQTAKLTFIWSKNQSWLIALWKKKKENKRRSRHTEWENLCRPLDSSAAVSRFGLAVRLVSGRTSVRSRFGSPFSSKRLWFGDTVHHFLLKH